MMKTNILAERLAREKLARQEAESILEKKSRELYEINIQLKKFADDLVGKEARHRLILDATVDGIVLLDDNLKIVSANPAATQLLDYNEIALIGAPFFDLLFNITDQRKPLRVENILLQASKKGLYEAMLSRTYLESIPIEFSVSVSMVDEKKSIICVLRDISERKRTEQYFVLQHTVSRILIDATSVEGAIHTILQKMTDILQMKMANMWSVDQNECVLRLQDSYYFNTPELKKFHELSSQFSFSAGQGLAGHVYQNNKICEIEDISQERQCPRAPLAVAAGLHAALAFPLCVENRVVGVIELFSEKITCFNFILLSVMSDIGNQIAIFLEKEQTRKNLLNIQRVAGIAEVTTGMLHNVGNILNSVNISLSVLEDKFKHSKLSNLLLIRDLLKSHENDFSTFIATTEKGKHFPAYLIELSNYWEVMRDEVHREMAELMKWMRHINDILKSQQGLAASFGMVEPVQVNLLLDEALRVNIFTTHIDTQYIKREYADIPLILVDRIKLLQILINLIKNAIHAVEHNTSEKTITLKTRLNDDYVCIEVSDNGYGIEGANLDKIFNYGFSTKEGGHGFGLHASAIYAQEMGGSLTASSEGVGQGATFVLLLPKK